MNFTNEVELKRSKKKSNSNIPTLPPITPVSKQIRAEPDVSPNAPNFETLRADSLRQISDSPKARLEKLEPPKDRSKLVTREGNLGVNEFNDIEWSHKDSGDITAKDIPKQANATKAKEHRELTMLRGSPERSKFSYWRSSVESIIGRSESHPSFGIYLFFLKRLTFTLFLCLFSICQVVYLLTCNFYEDKDIRFGIEKTTLGNLDGLDYKAYGSLAKEIQMDNASKGRDIILPCQVLLVIFFLLFVIYHIIMVNHESRNVENLTIGKNWKELKDKPHPISIKEFTIFVTEIDRSYEGDISSDLKNTFNKYGGNSGLFEIVPMYEYGNILKNQLRLSGLNQQLSDLKAREGINKICIEGKIRKIVSKIERLEKSQSELCNDFQKTKIPKEIAVLFHRLKDRNDCLDAYSSYSNWWSRPSKMPQDMKLNSKYGFKVHQGVEPFEINLEQDSFWKFKSLSFWAKSFYILGALLLISVISGLCLHYSINEVREVYNAFPNYKD